MCGQGSSDPASEWCTLAANSAPTAPPVTACLQCLRACSSYLRFKYRQDIARWIFKPRDVRPPAARDPLLVGHQVALIVGLEQHALPGQLVYRLLNVGDREIQDGEGGRHMVVLRIHQDRRAPI